jgi:HEAT repeat protein
MRKRTRTLLITMLIGLPCAIAFVLFDLHEPSFEGKPLSSWLQDLDDQHPGPEYDRAKAAIQHMGRDAVPYIVNVLEKRESSKTQKFLRWAIAHNLRKAPYVPVIESQHHAVLACNVLGPEAKAAIPALVALLNDGYTRGYVGAALGRIGSPAVIPMIDSLTNTNFMVRVEVAHAFGNHNFQSSSRAIISALTNCLADKNSTVRALAANSLGELGQEPETAVPALAQILSDPDTQVRWNGCLAIGKFGQQAEIGKNSVLGAFGDPDDSVRSAAAIALVSMEPQVASTIDKAMPSLIDALVGLKVVAPYNPLNLRYTAIKALEPCGPRARAAVPALLECLQDRNNYVKDAAARCLQAIDPDAAAKAGVK